MTEHECDEAIELYKKLKDKNGAIDHLANARNVSVTVAWVAPDKKNGHVSVHQQNVAYGESPTFIAAMLRQFTAERDAVLRRLAQLGCAT